MVGVVRSVDRTEAVPGDGPKVPSDCTLATGRNDAWRVGDVRMDEIKMATDFRSSCGRNIRPKGMDSRIALLGRKREALSEQAL